MIEPNSDAFDHTVKQLTTQSFVSLHRTAVSHTALLFGQSHCCLVICFAILSKASMFSQLHHCVVNCITVWSIALLFGNLLR